MIEINLPAKVAYMKFLAAERRADMKWWRTRKTLPFPNQESYDQWLAYTKWHKRPTSIVKDEKGYLQVTFLDYKKTKHALD